MLRFFPLLSLVILGSAPTALEGEPEKGPRQLQVRPATSEIVIDGRLEEPAWAQAVRYDLPYEWFPDDNVPAPVETEFLVTYDEARLYVAWICHDPRPAEIRAHLMDRDAIETFIQDDHVVLMLDPFNDERRGFQFRIDPLGVQADAIFSKNEGIEDFSFDMIWASAGRITGEGYVVEVEIPFAQLRFPGTGEAQTWGFDVGRSYPRNVRHRLLAWPRDRNQGCILCQVDKVSGFSGMKPGRNLEPAPTATVIRTDRRDPFPEGGLSSGAEDTELGLSARWGLTTNFTLSAAVNPDFSQVEADVAQLDVGRPFGPTCRRSAWCTTVLFAGYSDTSIGNQSLDLVRRDRTFFLKLGCALAL